MQSSSQLTSGIHNAACEANETCTSASAPTIALACKGAGSFPMVYAMVTGDALYLLRWHIDREGSGGSQMAAEPTGDKSRGRQNRVAWGGEKQTTMVQSA